VGQKATSQDVCVTAALPPEGDVDCAALSDANGMHRPRSRPCRGAGQKARDKLRDVVDLILLGYKFDQLRSASNASLLLRINPGIA